ncbi:biotin-dependent carboxyltransferase family protein [Maritalea sp.]|uniref:5-oxoprolinase subunit C family protein n=1 Tax=Maritalea sp. TaxID=2003361 RepID=UPI003EF1D0C7
MIGSISILRISPNSTIQDAGRALGLQFGLSASGPMDRKAFARTHNALDGQGSQSVVEFSMLGIEFTYAGPPMECAVDGGEFQLRHNGSEKNWPAHLFLTDGDQVNITTGRAGNYGYIRFAQALNVPLMMGSKSTNLAAGIGGLESRALRAGDKIDFEDEVIPRPSGQVEIVENTQLPDNLVRVLPGLHAELLGPKVWASLFEAPFKISNSIDRMGFRLNDPLSRFDVSAHKNIVSDAVVPGDIQILGDGTPAILMRDHQPIGGYPRIATIIDADLDYVAQLRPNREISFISTTLQKAHKAMEVK